LAITETLAVSTLFSWTSLWKLLFVHMCITSWQKECERSIGKFENDGAHTNSAIVKMDSIVFAVKNTILVTYVYYKHW